MKGIFAVPSGVEALRRHAFFRSALTQVILPDTLCTIDELAFEDCTNLESLYLPASVTSVTSIGDQPDWDSPAANCPKLQAITVDPANPKYFSIDGVLYCKDNGCLLTYPSGKSGSFDTPDFVLEYASDAFRGCRNLTSIRLGANVTRIGNGVFVGCTSLTELHLHAQIEQLDLFALSGCTNLKDIYIDAPALDILLFTDDDAFLCYCKKKFLHTFNQGNLTIHAPAESTAAKFAEQCAVKFEPVLG